MEVAAVFEAYPPALRRRLLRLRELIFETHAGTAGVSELEETLKWGQPSYLNKSGTTIRIDRVGEGEEYALYVHCQTDLIDRFRRKHPDTFQFEGSRAIRLRADAGLPEPALKEFIAGALRYHLDKKRTAGRRQSKAR